MFVHVLLPVLSYLTLKRVNRIKRRLRNNHFFRTQTGRKHKSLYRLICSCCVFTHLHVFLWLVLQEAFCSPPTSENLSLFSLHCCRLTLLQICLCFQGQRQQMLVKATIQTAKTASKWSLRWDRHGVALPAYLATVYLLGVIRADYFLLNFFVCFV